MVASPATEWSHLSPGGNAEQDATIAIAGDRARFPSVTIAAVFAEINALADAGLVQSYALGGALAAVRYLEPVATQDVDVFVLFRPEDEAGLSPLAPIYDFLVRRGARPEGAHVVIGSWPVQVLPADDPLVRKALRAATSVTVEGQNVRVLSAEYLAAIALDTGRAKDKIRVTQFLEWEGFNRSRFEQIVRSYPALLAKWATFRRQFLNEA